MMNLVKGSLQIELDRFFEQKTHSSIPCREVTSSAYGQARRKVSYRAFTELREEALELYYQSPLVKRWMGHRLLAVDSSCLKLPCTQDNLQTFGKPNPHSNHPVIRISQLYDISNRQTVDFIHSKHAVGERNLAAEHLCCAQENDLILYDRGYSASWLIALHEHKKIEYCMRIKTNFSSQIADFMSSKSTDKTISLEHKQTSRKECRARGLPLDAINVRLIKVRLSTGEIELLATSLTDKKTYPKSLFKELYHQRWFIEEDYKLMKSRLEFENFTGKSPECILQDIYAKLLVKNFSAVIYQEIEYSMKSSGIEHVKGTKVNFTYCLNKLKDKIITIILSRKLSKKILEAIIEQCAYELHRNKPGRTHPRNISTLMGRCHAFAYKRTV